MVIRDIPINTIAPSWLPRAQNMAHTLFMLLFTIEIFMLGLYAVLNGQGIANLISSFAFKTFILTFFIYLMSNAPTILPAIINSFKIAGQTTGVSATKNLMDMYHQADSAAELYFCAAMASHIDDQQTALQFGFFGNSPPGNGDYVHTFQGAVGHITFEFLVQGLGMLVIAGTGIMFLSLALITTESYITMFAGVFFIGLASTRFTLPFAQGYLAYTLNVGVKMFTYWILIAVESDILLPLLTRAGQGLIQAASIQFGAQAAQSQELYLVYASVDGVQILAMGGLTWILPSAMGRYVTDRNGASVINAITSMASSFKSTPAAAAGSIMPIGGPENPADSPYITPPKGPVTTVVDSVVAPPPPKRGNPFPMQTQTFTPPSSTPSPTLTESAESEAAASINDKSILSGTAKQAVQVSVAAGGDPFAAKPTIDPIIIVRPQRKRSGADPTGKNNADDEAQHRNTVPDLVQPNPATNSGIPNTIFQQNAGATKRPSSTPTKANSSATPAGTASGATPSANLLGRLPIGKIRKTATTTLATLSADQIRLLQPEEFVLLLEGTQWSMLSPEQLDAIEHDEGLRTIANKINPQRRRDPETS